MTLCLLAAELGLAAPLAAGNAVSPVQAVSLTVAAAASLKEALASARSLYAREHPEVKIVFDLGASGMLEQQIEQGAPFDVFISASPHEMNRLQSKGLVLPGTQLDLLRNSLVLIAPIGSTAVSSFDDLQRASVRRIAMADPEGVPAGMYARQTLTCMGLYEKLRPKLVLGGDVREVLAYVETGNAEAGLVYATDARITNQVKVVAKAPAGSHQPIVYPVAVLQSSRNAAAARQFVKFLESGQARHAFESQGFCWAGQ